MSDEDFQAEFAQRLVSEVATLRATLRESQQRATSLSRQMDAAEKEAAALRAQVEEMRRALEQAKAVLEHEADDDCEGGPGCPDPAVAIRDIDAALATPKEPRT